MVGNRVRACNVAESNARKSAKPQASGGGALPKTSKQEKWSEMATPNEDVRKCIEGVAKLIEESLPIVYYATSEEIEDDHVYGFKNPEWYLLSPGDFEKLQETVRGQVRLVHVREMPVEAWPPPTFMAEQLLDNPSFRLGRAWGLKV